MEAFDIFVEVWVEADPWVGVSGGFALELSCFVVPLGGLEGLFFEVEDGVGRHEGEVFFSGDGHVEVFVGIFVEGGDGLIVAEP